MSLLAVVNKIKKISFYLFTVSILSLIGSVFLNNSLINFKYAKGINENILKPIPGYTITKEFNCTQNLDDCQKNTEFNLLKQPSSLGSCFKNTYTSYRKLEKSTIIK